MKSKKIAAFGWNMVGSTCYAITSFIYLIVVTRICGVEQGGFFSLSYATAQLLLTFGRYGMRTYQATDLRSEYSFYEYGVSRVITVVMMLLLGVVYSICSFEKNFIITSALIIAMKAMDAIEDVYHGRLQQTDYVEQMGKAQAIRNVYTLLCFTGMLLLTHELLITLVVTVVTSVIICFVVNQYMINKHIRSDQEQRCIEYKAVFRLLRMCTGIFIGTFLSLLIYNIPKYAMAQMMDIEYQTYFSILFMPTFVITLLCEFIFKPTITSIAEKWDAGKKTDFKRLLFFNYGIIMVFSVIVLIGGHFVGRWLLELLYGVDLSPYKLDFVILLLGGSVSSLAYFTYNILIAIRFEKSIKITYGIVTVVCVFIIQPLVKYFGMTGAAINYLISQGLLFLIFLGTFLHIYYKHEKTMLNEAETTDA